MCRFRIASILSFFLEAHPYGWRDALPATFYWLLSWQYRSTGRYDKHRISQGVLASRRQCARGSSPTGANLGYISLNSDYWFPSTSTPSYLVFVFRPHLCHSCRSTPLFLGWGSRHLPKVARTFQLQHRRGCFDQGSIRCRLVEGKCGVTPPLPGGIGGTRLVPQLRGLRPLDRAAIGRGRRRSQPLWGGWQCSMPAGRAVPGQRWPEAGVGRNAGGVARSGSSYLTAAVTRP